MDWWLWVLSGIALLAFEVATPGGFFALFFGIGALMAAPLAALGFSDASQWFAFSIFSVVGLLTLRGPVMRRLARPAPQAAEIVGEEAVLLTDFQAGAEGRAELRGSPWSARISSGIPLKAGQRCRVERVEGLTLWLRAE